jgi:hypothetical protein
MPQPEKVKTPFENCPYSIKISPPHKPQGGDKL